MVIDRQGVAGACRDPLRPAALETLRRYLHMPCIVRHVQYTAEVDALADALEHARKFLHEEAAMSLDEANRRSTCAKGSCIPSIPPEELARLSDERHLCVETVYDPEIPADIFELGLIYKIDIEDDRMVKIMMTLTAPAARLLARCPAGRKCGRRGRRRLGRRSWHDLRSAMDAGPHVGRGAGIGGVVLIRLPAPTTFE